MLIITNIMTKRETIKEIIAQLGGYDACVERFNCTDAALRLWVSTQVIPEARLRHIRDIRPDLYELYESKRAA